jgi:hypothetical protein
MGEVVAFASHIERGIIEAAIRAAITDAVRDVVDGTVSLGDALDDKVVEINRDLREEFRDLKREVVCLTSLLAELRSAKSNELDLPRLPLRPIREIN